MDGNEETISDTKNGYSLRVTLIISLMVISGSNVWMVFGVAIYLNALVSRKYLVFL